ncbi:MAG: hypothetical protein AAGD04_04615 [Pseudomonadota bacterium]
MSKSPNLTPSLFDRGALDRSRSRAKLANADFLHKLAADEIKERLQDVKKEFKRIAIVSGAPDFWGDFILDAECLPDDDVLDFRQKSYDLIIHAMALHWSNDPVGQLIQCRMALAPNGLLLTVCFGGKTLESLRSALIHAEVTITGGASPRVAPMADVRDLGGLLQRAGLSLPVTDCLS